MSDQNKAVEAQIFSFNNDCDGGLCQTEGDDIEWGVSESFVLRADYNALKQRLKPLEGISDLAGWMEKVKKLLTDENNRCLDNMEGCDEPDFTWLSNQAARCAELLCELGEKNVGGVIYANPNPSRKEEE